jgi:hypothetical protein
MAKWGFITAAFGNSSMIRAGKRLSIQASNFGLFHHIYNFKYEDLESWAPETFTKYQNFLNIDHKGFGYYMWKPELIKNVLMRDTEIDGILWLDAGCELFYTPWNKWILNQKLTTTSKDGYLAYQLDYPEIQYTKNDLFDFFSANSRMKYDPQFQATFIGLHGLLGKQIAKTWFESSIVNIRNVDLSPSKSQENFTFIEHRFDQSVFSLTMKSMQLKSNCKVPPSRVRSIKSLINCFFNPVWTARNRSGVSIIPKKFRVIVELLTLQYFFNRI